HKTTWDCISIRRKHILLLICSQVPYVYIVDTFLTVSNMWHKNVWAQNWLRSLLQPQRVNSIVNIFFSVAFSIIWCTTHSNLEVDLEPSSVKKGVLLFSWKLSHQLVLRTPNDNSATSLYLANALIAPPIKKI
ncbi:hypothetical protein CR513_48299, partial [Mucuna pruriens]